MNYIGEKCAACGEVFTAEDDVVVCPECGSPHHRDCYMSAGKCANESYHAEKKKWEREVNKDKVFVVCPACHFPNSRDDDNCERCGADLKADPSEYENKYVKTDIFPDISEGGFGQSRPYLGFDPNEDLGGATVKEVSEFVGTNTLYYLPIFKRMKDIGSKISLNFICLVFPSLYFANRKMWGWAILAVILNVIFRLPAFCIYMADNGGLSEYITALVEDNRTLISQLDVFATFLDFGVKLLFCLLGNSMYFNYIVRSLKKIRESGSTYMGQRIAEMGGIKPVNMILITVVKAAVTAGIIILIDYIFGIIDFVDAFDSVGALGL